MPTLFDFVKVGLEEAHEVCAAGACGEMEKKEKGMYKKILGITMASLMACTAANAALLIYEGFDYAEGAFADGSNGGTGWDAGWADVVAGGPDEQIVAGSLVSPVPHLASTGNSLDVAGSGNRFYRSMGAQSIGTDGTTVYMSFLAQQLGTTVQNAAMELKRGSGTYVASMGSDSAAGVFGFTDKQNSANNISAGTFPAPDTDVHLWVLQFDFAAGSDTVSLTYDGNDLGSTTVADGSFDRIGAFFYSGTAGMAMDEIRVGTEFADVAIAVPEPATLGLLGLAFGSMIMLRRSRK